MAAFNEIGYGRFSRALQKLFGIKGAAPVPTLAPEIQPVHIVFHGIEDRFHEGWNRFGVGLFLGATVGQTAGIQIRNPLASNTIIVIDRIILQSDAAQELDLSKGSGQADLPTIAAVTSLDFRQNVGANIGPTSSVVSSSLASPGSLNLIERFATSATSSSQIIGTNNQELPLAPNEAFRIVSTVANTGMRLGFWWRERFLEEMERS